MPWITIVKIDEEPFTSGQVFKVTKSKEYPDFVDVCSLEGEFLHRIHQSECRRLFIGPIWTNERPT